MTSVTVTRYRTSYHLEVWKDTQLITWIDCFDREALEMVMHNVKQTYHPAEITSVDKR
jgi:repressor of nif and glnA expression